MKITNDPASPPVRFAGMLLHQVTEQDVTELRLSLDGDAMAIQFDGQAQPGPKAELFPSVTKAILRFAGLRLWPWSRKVSGKRLEVEFESSGITSSWELETQDIKRELALTRI